jgi:hypothetical protein
MRDNLITEMFRSALGIDHLFERVRRLEHRMSAVDDIITALNTATDEIASDLAALRDEISGGDTATAAKFAPLLDRLTALGQDPENPIPGV